MDLVTEVIVVVVDEEVAGPWKARKLTTEVYESEYLFKTRDGVVHRKRNLDACREREESERTNQEIEARIKRIRGNPDICRPWPRVPAAEAWLSLFKKDAFRYALLVVLGNSDTGAGRITWPPRQGRGGPRPA